MPLALDDTGLAILIRAAREVPHRERSAWLRRTARRLEAGASAAARRQRAYRARQQRGKIVVPLHVDEDDVRHALCGCGALKDAAAADRATLARAMNEQVNDWLAAWRPPD